MASDSEPINFLGAPLGGPKYLQILYIMYICTIIMVNKDFHNANDGFS